VSRRLPDRRGRIGGVPDVWDDVARWWVDAVRDDPANSTDFHSLLDELLGHVEHGRRGGGLTLDVGCGEGQAMRAIDGSVIGTDVSMELLRHARSAGPVVCGRLPDLSWARSGAFDRAVCVSVLEVVADHHALFRELHRVTRRGGRLFAVANHPVVTAPYAEPLVDPDGEILWSWGRYLEPGPIEQELGGHTVVLHHRPFGELLTAAATAGWQLERLVEHGPSAATRDRYPEYHGQRQVPVLLGAIWRSDPDTG
jgi:SAM-dependent methyltransferase